MRPVLYILIPFCLGVAFGQASSAVFDLPVIYSFLSGLLFIALSLLSSARKTLSHVSLYLAIFFLGISYYHNSNIIPAGHIANITSERPQKVVLKGVIADDPAAEETFYGARKINFLLKVDAAGQPGRWQKAEGLAAVRVITNAERRFHFGDAVILEGLISKPVSLRNPGLFDYAKYLANRNIYSVLKVKDGNRIEVLTGNPANPIKRLAYRIRFAIRSTLDKYLDNPDDSFMKAMLIGDRSGLGNELNDKFIKTGTIHIISISGLHVGLIAGLVLAVFGLLGVPKKFNLALTVIFLAVYSYVAGSSPPIIRAVLMFTVFAVGYIIERETDLLNSLSVAAFLILLWNPKALFDPSFQLSFASIAGIFIFAPKIDGILKAGSIGKSSFWRKAATYAVKGVSVSIAAWIGTWPIIASYFNIASPVSVIANLVVIPMSFVSMIASIVLLCVSPFSSTSAGLIAFGLGFFDKALFWINGIFSQMPLAYFRLPAPSAVFMAAYYGLVLLWAIPSEDPIAGNRSVNKRWALAAILLALNLLVWKECANTLGGRLKATFLDVGQGDSAFVEFPGGGNLLIDAGSGGEEGTFDAGRNVVAPYIWNELSRRIDVIIVTHPHSDHLGGVMYLLKNFKVGIVIDNGSSDGSGLYAKYLQAIRDGGAQHITVGEGDRIGLSSGAELFILSPEKGMGLPDANAGSLVGKLAYKTRSILFCGDATGVAMNRMLDSFGYFLRSDMMKVPHHGGNVGDETTINKFFSVVSPAASIISAGRSTHYDRRQIEAITHLNSICYNTSQDGAIIVYIGSTGYSIRPFINKN